MSHYLVTGGAGFIGTNVVKHLVALGHRVRVLDNYAGGRFSDRIVAGVEYREGDVTDAETVLSAVAKVDGIFHLAALPRVAYSVAEPLHTHEVNTVGTIHVLRAAKEHGSVRVVFSSSSAVYGDQPIIPLVETMKAMPLSPYGLQKYEGEEYCRLFSELYAVPTVSLRYFNVYGPHMDPEGAYALVVGKFLRAKQRKEPMPICGDGEYYREYLHVHDVVRANVLAMESQRVGRGEVINIGGGRSTSVNELARLIGGPVVYVPPRTGDPRRSEADSSQAERLLGWRPTIVLEDGLADMQRQWGISS